MGVSDLAIAPGADVRVTPEEPPRYAFVDLMRLVLGDISQSHASAVISRAKKRLDIDLGRYRFSNGSGPAPMVCTMKEAEQIFALMGGTRAGAFRATGEPQPKKQLMEDLYVMRYSIDESAVKIGGSNKTESRRRALQASHNFWMQTLAVFPKKGYLEPKIHQKLQAVLSGRGAGVEWFDIHASHAVGVVSMLIQELEAAEEAEAAKKD
jgi:hypothetical protein